MILVGIDPGVKTGFAVWCPGTQVFMGIESLKIHAAMRQVLKLHEASPLQPAGELLVIFEDARQRTWFGAKGRESLQGAGSIKRDCTIWQDYLIDHGIPFIAQSPGRHPTKRTSEWFRGVTGWPGVTNEHARDAAMLVYGINAQRAALLMATARRKAA